MLEKYNRLGWELVQVASNGKNPVMLEWTSKGVKDVQKWEEWIENGYNVGVLTGEKSNVTVIDIDTQEIPRILAENMLDTLVQRTNKGFHFFYKYDKDLPTTRIDNLKIDILNNKRQCVIAPSEINEVKRDWEELEIDPIEMPKDIKEWLLNQIHEVKNFYHLPECKLEEGTRNASLISLGGILRKELSPHQTQFVINVVNKRVSNNPLPQNEINALCKSLWGYTNTDLSALKCRILDYLQLVGVASISDLERATREEPEGLARVLYELQTDGYVIPYRKDYKFVKRPKWKTEFLGLGEPIDFQVPYFDEIAYFCWGDMILVGSQTGGGKCLVGGSKVLMYDGTLKIVEDIKVGDEVMGIDSNKRTVKKIGSGFGDIVSIVPMKGKSFCVNREHILSLKNTTTDETVNISVNEYLAKNKTFKHLHKLYSVPVEFKEREITLEPYWLGLWLGDGDSRDSRITNVDKEVIDYIEDYSERIGLIFTEYKYPNRAPSYKMSRGKEQIIKWSIVGMLKNMGLIKNKHIPENYKINSRKNRLELLAGLLDSDGYYHHGFFEITTVSQILKDDIFFLARSLGFMVTYRIKDGYYRMNIIGDVSVIPTRIKRKKATHRKMNKNPLHTGFSIEEITEDEFFGFELDGDSLYMDESFFVSHNTHVAINMLKKLVDQNIKPYYITTEAGSRFLTIAKHIGIKEGDFYWDTIINVENIQLPEKSVVILDWLMIEDKSMTDKVFQLLQEQLFKSGGLLIVFQQLKDFSNDWFAPNMCKQFPALATKYLMDKEDHSKAKFIIEKRRDPKGRFNREILCEYNWATKEVRALEAGTEFAGYNAGEEE